MALGSCTRCLAILALTLLASAPAMAAQPMPRPKPVPPILNVGLAVQQAVDTSSQLLGSTEALAPPPTAEPELRIRPQIAFETWRPNDDARFRAVDPGNMPPLVRNRIGIDSSFVQKSFGLEVAREGEVGEVSRLRLGVESVGNATDSVSASIAVPLN
jgi:hypothetical protein